MWVFYTASMGRARSSWFALRALIGLQLGLSFSNYWSAYLAKRLLGVSGSRVCWRSEFLPCSCLWAQEIWNAMTNCTKYMLDISEEPEVRSVHVNGCPYTADSTALGPRPCRELPAWGSIKPQTDQRQHRSHALVGHRLLGAPTSAAYQTQPSELSSPVEAHKLTPQGSVGMSLKQWWKRDLPRSTVWRCSCATTVTVRGRRY